MGTRVIIQYGIALAILFPYMLMNPKRGFGETFLVAMVAFGAGRLAVYFFFPGQNAADTAPLESSSGLRVTWEQLEKGEKGEMVFEGTPFTGICNKNYYNPLTGAQSREWEMSFVNGKKEGPSRNFDAEGNLLRIEYYTNGAMTKVKNFQ